MKDPYATLGVARGASDDEIRSRYRELARRYHPDVNPDDASAEERFKAASQAYAILSDADKRAAYDEFGEASLQGGFDAEAARRASRAFGGSGGGHPFGGGGMGGFEDLLSGLFGRGGPRPGRGMGPRPGPDLEATLELDFLEAALGGEQRITLDRPTAEGGIRHESVNVKIPAGVADGGRIRLRGKGGVGIAGGPAGDLYARIRTRPHPYFRREDRDVSVDVPISVLEAMRGAKVEIPTLDGRVTLTVPPGTQGGTRLRLRGKGIAHTQSGGRGDLYAVVQIRVPERVSEETLEALEQLDELSMPNLRRDLD
ncbi:J domain-containing protein [Myxococcota bacterium]|nr:J domain-containing protein [Myxococcota bacterium]